jgi:hypothetical protein
MFYMLKKIFMIHVQNCEADLTLPGRNILNKKASSVSRIRPRQVGIHSLSSVMMGGMAGGGGGRCESDPI